VRALMIFCSSSTVVVGSGRPGSGRYMVGSGRPGIGVFCLDA
jgi:hypothetical protein